MAASLQFEEQRENTSLFKEEIRLENVRNGGDRGGNLMASRGRFRGHRLWLEFCDRLETIPQ